MAKPKYAYRLGWRSLQRVAPHLTTAQAKSLARDLGQAMVDFNITTKKRATFFIAQIAHESGGFRFREEIASGAAYEGRRDLGNVFLGDGVRYKGRTFIQITGRTNYVLVSKALGVDFVKHPTWLAHQQYAAKGAAWWFASHGCNALCDKNDFLSLTHRINGGFNGLAERQAYLRRARLVAPFLVPKRRKP